MNIDQTEVLTAMAQLLWDFSATWGLSIIALLVLLYGAKVYDWFRVPVIAQIDIEVPIHFNTQESCKCAQTHISVDQDHPEVFHAEDSDDELPLYIREFLDTVTEPLPFVDLP
ncbi:unnamed protein product [Caenorhabditis sp. 36 PRJEB53466]|nr:unnamed protein product [Caenorhabditis sp. 36 PRJEB53466]